MTTQQIIIDHQARGVPASSGLKSDVLDGFREAVRNNQPTLALEYLRFVVDELLMRVSPPTDNADELESRITELEETVKTLKASLAPSRKVIKKEVDENVE